MSKTIRRNPIAKAVTRIRPQIVRPKKGRGSYSRKSKGDQNDA